MNKVDIIIVLLIILGIFIGYKRGILVETINIIGLFLALILAFLLKNNVSIILYKNLPFFSLDGIFKGISVVNILIYELIAFLLVLLLALIAVKTLKLISKLMEKILRFSKILSLPSKLLGAILGGIKTIVIVFIVSYIIVGLNYNYIDNSIVCKSLLSNYSIFYPLIEKPMYVYEEFNNLKEEFKLKKDSNEFNMKALDLFLKRGIITIDSVELLYKKGKLKFNGIELLIKQYKEE